MHSLSVSASSEFPLQFPIDCSGSAQSTSSASALSVVVVSNADGEEPVKASFGGTLCGSSTVNPGGANIIGDDDDNVENIGNGDGGASHDEVAAVVTHGG